MTLYDHLRFTNWCPTTQQSSEIWGKYIHCLSCTTRCLLWINYIQPHQVGQDIYSSLHRKTSWIVSLSFHITVRIGHDFLTVNICLIKKKLDSTGFMTWKDLQQQNYYVQFLLELLQLVGNNMMHLQWKK